MDGLISNIEDLVRDNDFFRHVIFTGPHSQLVLMSIEPEEEIGWESHHVDQFIYIIEGGGTAHLDQEEKEVGEGWAIFIPAGTEHNVVNNGEVDLKLFSVYSPPEHPDQLINETKKEAE